MSRLLGDIGTIEWCRRTNGLLDRGDRIRFVAGVFAATARLTPRLLAARVGLKGHGPDPSEFAPPDSALVGQVLDACHDLEPMVIEHSYRSYLFARALGAAEQRVCDPEALFIAAMLHDYAFATMDTIDDRCFAFAGAEVADELLRNSALPAELRHDVLDAVTLHLNPFVGPGHGTLQHLLHDGITADVVGARLWHLDPDGIQRVVAAHPRLSFVTRGAPLLQAHGRRVRGTRTRALVSCGFVPALQLGPWIKAERAAGAS